MKRYVAILIDRSGILIREEKRRRWKGGRGGQWFSALSGQKRATGGGTPINCKEAPGSIWTGAKLGQPQPGQPRRLPRGAAFINSSWWGEAPCSIFPAGAFQPGTSILIYMLEGKIMLFTSWISKSLLNGDMKRDPPSYFHFSHMVALPPTGMRLVGSLSYFLTQFNTLLPTELVISPPNTPNSLGWQRQWVHGHLIVIRHSNDEHMEEAVSLLSSADQLSTWELPLPGSPSKLSPGCLWVSSCCHLPLTWVPSRNGGKKKKTKTEHPLLPHSGSQHGGPVFSPVLYFKENCRWLEPLPVRATTNTEFWSYGNNWQDDLTIHRSELKWSHFQTIKRQTLPLALSKQFELVFCSRKNIAMSRTEKTTTCSCVLRIRWISWNCDHKVTSSLKTSHFC